MILRFSARILLVAMAALLLALLSLYFVVAQESEGVVDPASVPGLVPFQNVQSLSAGGEGNCTVTSASALFCWGNGFNGQNGNGTNDFLSTPTAVMGLSNVLQVNRGDSHTCAVVQGGDVYCWGVNSSGQFGTGTTSPDPSLVPVQSLLSGVSRVSVGSGFTCALKTNGTVFCTGTNSTGQLGIGTVGGISASALQVVGISDAVAIDSGNFHTCALLDTGEVKCWGNTAQGQIGIGSVSGDVATPALALLPEDVSRIPVGSFTTCALAAGGKAYCWGSNTSGQVAGIGTSQPISVPFTPQYLETSIVGIDTNSSNTCAWTQVGLAYCWGDNIGGQLGAGPGPGGIGKVSVMGLPAPVRSLAVGDFHVCAILSDNRAVCWGSNQGNALGDGTNLPSFVPTYVRVPSTCFQLSVARTGSGAFPVVTPTNSNGCPIGHFVAGTLLTFAAVPNAQNRVNSWSAPVAFQAGDTMALLSMPNADTTATVTYATCRVLTRTHTGNGGNPTPSFNNSSGCSAGRYAPGEVIQLAATPSTNQRVQAWSGTSIAPGLGLGVNSVTMPNADLTVNVTYQPCNMLTLSATGEGEVPGVFPAASEGCAAGTFVEGQAIQFTAAPAAGFRVSGWSGTANDASTALTNSLTMPASDRSVSVTYVSEQTRTLLPLVNQ